MIAKTDQAHQHLQAQLKAKTARREYLGIIYGAPASDGMIDRQLVVILETATKWLLSLSKRGDEPLLPTGES